MTRKPLSRALRFEVFRRDRFACQYCGESAPKVVLHVDHIQPVSKGGGNEITNLVTACSQCNGGKSNKILSDESMSEKQLKQLVILEKRREQLDMIREWKELCDSVGDQELELVESVYSDAFSVAFSDPFAKKVKRLIKKHGIGIVLDGAQKVCEYYDDAEKACSKLRTFIEGIIADTELPGSSRIPYVIAILKNRLSYTNAHKASQLMACYLKVGGDIEDVVVIAKEVRSFTRFSDAMAVQISKLRESDHAAHPND